METCRYDLRVTRLSMHGMFLGKVRQFTRLSAVRCSDEVRITQHAYMVRDTAFGSEIYQRFTSTSQISSLRDDLDLMVCTQNRRYTATIHWMKLHHPMFKAVTVGTDAWQHRPVTNPQVFVRVFWHCILFASSQAKASNIIVGKVRSPPY
jgi:hypothetical protein